MFYIRTIVMDGVSEECLAIPCGSLHDRPVSILFESRKLEEYACYGTNTRTICVRAT